MRNLALVGFFFGFPGLGMWVPLWPSLISGSLSRGAESVLFWLIVPFTLLISIALPPLLLHLRGPRTCVLRWDAWGIVEYEGTHVRTAIEWTRARATVGTRSEILRITDDEGRSMTVAKHGNAPPWLRNRRASASAEHLHTLCHAVVNLPRGPEILPDDRDARRPTIGLHMAIITWIFGLLGVVLLSFVLDLSALVPAFLALIVSLFCAMPALKPIHELFALLAEARCFDRAVPMTLEEGDEPCAWMRRRDGALFHVDVQSAKHPDARLASRDGTRLFVVLQEAFAMPVSSRSRNAPPLPAIAIETEYQREVRRSLMRSTLIELGARATAVCFWIIVSLMPVLG
jgi:hypothetical protein